MELGISELSLIIEKVLKEMCKRDIKSEVSDGIFDTMEEAIEAAYEAQKKYSQYTIEQREKLIAAMRKAILDNAMAIATLCSELI